MTHGLFEFTINNIEPGDSVELVLCLPEGARPDSYLKYGPTPDDLEDHWYEFVYDGVTGAEIDGNMVTLHFLDGDEGDDVLTPDGMTVDAGGPMVDATAAPDSKDYGPVVGGCFANSLSSADKAVERFGRSAAGALTAMLCLAAVLGLKAVRRIIIFSILAAALVLSVPEQGLSGDNRAGNPEADTSIYLNVGIGMPYLDENFGADYQGQRYELTVDSGIYPLLRAGCALSDSLALELGFR